MTRSEALQAAQTRADREHRPVYVAHNGVADLDDAAPDEHGYYLLTGLNGSLRDVYTVVPR